MVIQADELRLFACTITDVLCVARSKYRAFFVLGLRQYC